jgi:hypothetical protein
MVGRFVYFDASFMDFITALKNMVKNIYLLILGLLLTGLLAYFGFSEGYLLERNYYLVGVFYTHLFMLAAVFVLHHSHVLHLIVRKPRNYDQNPEEELPAEDEYVGYEDEAYEEYEEYEDSEYEEGYYNMEEYGDEDEY